MYKLKTMFTPAAPTTSTSTPDLEVVVTDQQCTMTFNGEQVHICEEVEIPIPNPYPKV